MIEPLVSVVIPFYSNEKWLVEALESVLNQTYHKTEILVINDGSLEDISGTVLNYGNRVRFISKVNEGPASARNTGIVECTGKYIAFLDSDDIWLEKKLEEQIFYMERNKSIWSQHSYEMFWENTNKTKTLNTNKFDGNVYKDCFISFKIQTSCVVVKKDILMQDNIRFPLNKRFGQDLDFYKQIAKNYCLDFVEGVHSKFRIRGTNAGFQAKIQISDRASVWLEIQRDEKIRKILPKSVIFAYKTSFELNKVINSINNKFTDNKNVIELLSKILYIVPYTMFKVNINRK